MTFIKDYRKRGKNVIYVDFKKRVALLKPANDNAETEKPIPQPKLYVNYMTSVCFGKRGELITNEDSLSRCSCGE